MHSPDLYILAQAVLDGDRDGRKVLADLLEEQGERGLAQWARRGKNKSENRIDLTLMLLPAKTAILAGVDFVEAAYGNDRSMDGVDECVARIRRWADGEISNNIVIWEVGKSSIYGANFSAPGYVHPVTRARQAVEQLTDAIRAYLEAIRCRETDELAYKALHLEMEAKQRIREVSYITRREAPAFAVQLNQLKLMLQTLLQPTDLPWPK